MAVAVLPPPSEEPSGLVAVTVRTLQDADRFNTVLGQQAVALARRIEGPSADTGASVASLSRELREVMEAALQGAQRAADPIDELRAWRDRKRAAG